ncbi:MAG TPA: heme-binding domain-containing protein [Rhodothermales bacterium]
MASLRRVALRGAGILLLIIVALQFVRPERTNPPVDPAERLQAHVQVPADVQAILDRSCRDCHTNETRWPWYSAVAPMSFLLVHDVTEGRDELNFSEWGQYDGETMGEQLDHICTEVREGEMPMKTYTLVHSEARLSAQDVDRLCQWTKQAGATVAAHEETQ